MYTRKYKTKKTFANSSDTPTTNQFAPRRFVVQPAEAITPEQTPDLQTQGENPKQSSNNLANISIFSPEYETPNNPQVNPIHSQETSKSNTLVQGYFTYRNQTLNAKSPQIEAVYQYLHQRGDDKLKQAFIQELNSDKSPVSLAQWLVQNNLPKVTTIIQEIEQHKSDKDESVEMSDAEISTNKKRKQETSEVNDGKTELPIEEETKLKTKSKKKKSQEADEKTLRIIFKECLQSYNFPDEVYKSIAVDWELEKPYKKEEKDLLEMLDVKSIASCFDTAKRLFELVGDPDADATNSWNIAKNMGNAIPELIKDIKAHKNSACIYRCGINEVAHGFTIIIQNNRADVIQGFAGPDGESLSENLEDGTKQGGYSIKEITDLLAALISEDTFKAQNILFSGTVDIEKIAVSEPDKIKAAQKNKNWKEAHKDDQTDPNYRLFYRNLNADIFRYERRGLYSQEQLQQKIKSKISNNLYKLGVKIKK